MARWLASERGLLDLFFGELAAYSQAVAAEAGGGVLVRGGVPRGDLGRGALGDHHGDHHHDLEKKGA